MISSNLQQLRSSLHQCLPLITLLLLTAHLAIHSLELPSATAASTAAPAASHRLHTTRRWCSIWRPAIGLLRVGLWVAMTVSMGTTAVCPHHTTKHAARLVPWVLSPLAQTPSQRIAAILAIHGLSELVVTSWGPDAEVITNRCHSEELLVVRTCQLFH